MSSSLSSTSSRATVSTTASVAVVVSASAIAAAVTLLWHSYSSSSSSNKSPASNTRVKKHEVQFPAADGTGLLSGTLRLPKNATESPKGGENNGDTKLIPAAIVVHGSGPIDRNGNVVRPGGSSLLGGRGMEWNTYNQLAQALAEQTQGLAVLCYDKRGVGKSTSSSSNADWYYTAGLHDWVDDVVAAYRYLVTEWNHVVDVSSIVLVGHSEGAILLPLIAETIHQSTMSTTTTTTPSLPPPKGLVFLAGFGETLDEAATCQRNELVREVAQDTTGIKGWILRRLVTQEKVDEQYRRFLKLVLHEHQRGYESMYGGLVKIPTKWYREHLEWDARQSLRKCPLPMLTITGGKDVQVRAKFCEPEVAKKLAPHTISLEAHVLPNLTHTLRCMNGTPSLLNAQNDYSVQAKEPLEAELLTILDQWLSKLLR